MNISLTLNFDTMTELEAYLASRTTTKAAPAPAVVAPIAAPAPVAVAPAPAPVAVAPAPAPAPAPIAPAPVAAPTPTLVDDAATQKTRIMSRLKDIAAGMPDPSELGKFITAFGVQKFSQLPDAQLGQFEALMNQTYPA